MSFLLQPAPWNPKQECVPFGVEVRPGVFLDLYAHQSTSGYWDVYTSKYYLVTDQENYNSLQMAIEEARIMFTGKRQKSEA
jgi:hypothetical protein